MSHEVEYNEKTGEYNAIYARDPAWWRGGHVVPGDTPALYSIEEAIEVINAGFLVEKVPNYIFYQAEEDWYAKERTAESYSVVRTDKGTVLGTVGNQWQPLQNADAFRPIQPALDQRIAQIESGGVLREGRQVWMLVRFDTDEIIRQVAGHDSYEIAKTEAAVCGLFDEVLPYGLFQNDHSGNGKAVVKKTAIRVVCANTLDWSLQKEEGYDVAVEHSTNVAENYEAASAMLFRHVVLQFSQLANYRELFKETILPTEDYRRLVLDTAVPVKHLEAKIQRRDGTGHTEAALDKAGEKRDRIRFLWDNGAGHVGDHSAWEAWNGLLQWTDHEAENFRHSTLEFLGGSRGSLSLDCWTTRLKTDRGMKHW
jgi:phage/plasmid-like protein (TIGR03299 family)